MMLLELLRKNSVNQAPGLGPSQVDEVEVYRIIGGCL